MAVNNRDMWDAQQTGKNESAGTAATNVTTADAGMCWIERLAAQFDPYDGSSAERPSDDQWIEGRHSWRPSGR